MARGYYTRTVLAAWNWRGEAHARLDVRQRRREAGNKGYRGQGNHNLASGTSTATAATRSSTAQCAIDDDGKGLYTTGLGHGDAMHLSDLDPERPGLEVFAIQERFDDAGAHFRRRAHGEILWKKPSVKAGEDGEGPGRGLALDIDPRHRGLRVLGRGADIRRPLQREGRKDFRAAAALL